MAGAGAGGGGVGGDPRNISTGLIAWWEADKITGLSDTDPVSTWSDLSGNGKDLTNSGAARPLYNTNSFGTRPGVTFDAANTMLCSSAMVSHFKDATGAPKSWTLQIMCRTTTALNTIQWLFGVSSGPAYLNKDYIEGYTYTDGTMNFDHAPFTGSYKLAGTTSVTVDVNYVHTFVMASSGKTYISGTAAPGTPTASFQSGGHLFSGQRYQPNNEVDVNFALGGWSRGDTSSIGFGGRIYGAVMYDRALSYHDINKLEQYWQTKVGGTTVLALTAHTS